MINKIDLPSADIVRTQEAIEKAVGPGCHRCDSGEREDRAGRGGSAGGDCAPAAAADGRPGCAAAGADFRLVVRRVSRRDRAGARDAGNDAQGAADSADVEWEIV